MAGKAFPHLTKIVKTRIYREKCEEQIPQLAACHTRVSSGWAATQQASPPFQPAWGLVRPLLAHSPNLMAGGAVRLWILNQGKQTAECVFCKSF